MAIKIGLLVVLLVGIAAAAVLHYPQPGSRDAIVEIEGRQYYINHDGPTMEWIAASLRCREMGMQLVSFESQEKWEAIRSFLMETEYRFNSFWTSGVFVKDLTWVWSGLAEPLNFTAWGPGSPSGDNCVEMHGLDQEFWHDYPCSGYTSRYVCEFPPACGK